MCGLLAALACALAPAASAAPGPKLRAGVGRADITPPTGYPLGGFVRADRTGNGVHTRLYATAMVLQRGPRRVALVSIDLFAVPGGMAKEAAEQAGFAESEVLMSASHTHGGPSGFANFNTYNTIAPSMETITDPETFADFFVGIPTDVQLYSFLVRRITRALNEAKRDLAPAAAGWGKARRTSITRNRSVEAHLADHGLTLERGQGSPEMDPKGPLHTIDPAIDVLRVDQLRRRRGKLRRVPLGGWSMFANHGTVNPSTYEVYHQDHHGAANRVFEKRVRKRGHVPRRRLVVNVYGNGNAGDQSAGLDGQGPEIAERVGRTEGRAMFAAWRAAGKRLNRRPSLDLRWTRVCFCGQQTSAGEPVSDDPLIGMPFLTGSEEERGPLFDVTGIPFEGIRGPEGFDSQGHKIGAPGAVNENSAPDAVPLMVVRVGNRVLATMPGEPTVEVGRRIRAAVQAKSRRSGVRRVIVAAYANEYLSYFTTPEEYDRQHYEGGSTLYGLYASVFLQDQLAKLASRMARGAPAPEPYPFDPRNGIEPTGEPFSRGATSATIETQPATSAARGGTAAFVWRGGPNGFDRPLDRAFVIVERRGRSGRWRRVADDLGLEIVWRIDDTNRYTATWSVPSRARAGRHRIRIEGRRYRLTSRAFRVLHGG